MPLLFSYQRVFILCHYIAYTMTGRRAHVRYVYSFTLQTAPRNRRNLRQVQRLMRRHLRLLLLLLTATLRLRRRHRPQRRYRLHNRTSLCT